MWQPDWSFVFEPEWHERVKRLRSEKNIRTRLLVNDSLEEHEHLALYQAKQDTETRFLPKNQAISQFALYIMNDTANILSFEKNNLVGIQIVNQHLAKNFLQIGHSLWEQAASLQEISRFKKEKPLSAKKRKEL